MTSTLPDPLPPFSCTHTPNIPALLVELNCSLIISTYQAGKVILLSAFGEGLVQLPRNFNKPMGLAAAGSRLADGVRLPAAGNVSAQPIRPR